MYQLCDQHQHAKLLRRIKAIQEVVMMMMEECPDLIIVHSSLTNRTGLAA